MSVHLEHCTNIDCGRLFEVEQYSKAFGAGQVAGFIVCPYCLRRASGHPEKVYMSRKLTPELEDWPEVKG